MDINWGWTCTGLEEFPITRVKNNIIVYGDQGPLKYLWSNHFMMGNLMMGGSGIFITVTRRPGTIRDDFKKYGFDLSPYEREGKFFFVDLYPYFGKQSAERFRANIKDSTTNHISLELTKALKEANSHIGTIVLDSVSALMLYFKPEEVTRFVLEQAAKISDYEWSSLFIMEKGTTEERVERMLASVLDGVYEINPGDAHECHGEFTARWIKGVLDKPMTKHFKDGILVDHNICVERMRKATKSS